MTDAVDDAAPATPAVRTVTGTVAHLERIALPPGAVVTVRLQDVSRADAPATVLAQQAFVLDGQVPLSFELSVDAADVDDRASISAWARLRSAVGVWQTDTHAPVLTRGAGDHVDLVVRRVRSER